MNVRIKVILGLVVCLGALAVIATFRARQFGAQNAAEARRLPAVRTIKLQLMPYVVTESFYGTLEANIRVDMAFQISGRIKRLGPSEGSQLVEGNRVTAGQIIAQLEPDRYEAVAAEAGAWTQQAKAQLMRSHAWIAGAQATFDDAQFNLERMKQLYAASVRTNRELELAERDYKTAMADLEADKAQYVANQAAYQAAQSKQRTAQVNLTDAALLAPLDGLVADVHVEVGQMIQPGDATISLVDLSKVKLIIGVVERKLPLLAVGQQVSVDVMALAAQARRLVSQTDRGAPLAGLITIIPPAADPQTSLFNVEIELDNRDGRLFPGMVAHARVQIMQKMVLAVPADAAMRMGDRAAAFFVEDDASAAGPALAARRVILKPIVFDKDHYLVLDVPHGYDRLIVEGFGKLTDGQRVQIVGDSISHGVAEAGVRKPSESQ